MSPRQLLEKLENLGIIDPSLLERIRQEIDNPEKKVKPKAILRFLVAKNQMTEQQAARMLKSAPASKPATESKPTAESKPKKKTEDNLEYVQPAEKSYDTDDLTGVVNQPEVETDATIADHGATIADDSSFSPSGIDEVVEVEPETVVSEVYDPIEVGNEPMELPTDPLADHAAGGRDEGYDSGAYANQSGEQAMPHSFSGKRNKKDQWSTKWLYIGFGILGTILIGTAVTWFAVMGQKPEDMFEAAMNSYNKQSWSDAAAKFDEYLEAFPDHKDAKKARVRRVQAIIRGTYQMKNWAEVIQQADTLLPTLMEGEEVNLDENIRSDLAVMLPTALVEISKNATRKTRLEDMKKELETINGYFETVNNTVYIPPSTRKSKSVADNYARIDNNIRTLTGLIAKENAYNSDLVKIEEFGDAGKTDEAFGIYQKLIRNYGDLASRGPLRELMLVISDRERGLVKPTEVDLNISQTERNTLVENTIVMAVNSGEPVEALKDEVVNFLADGSVYGIDAGQGNIIWRRFVGYQTSIQPQDINDQWLAVADQRNHDLLALQKANGNIRWRAEIGEPFLMPTIGDDVIVVTTASGKIIQLNAATGEFEKAAQIPQKTVNVNALVATQNPYVYQAGYYSNIYVLNTLDYSCEEVYYLGHQEGSIVVPPQSWQGFILVAVNGGDYCDLHVLKPEKNGKGLKRIQLLSRVTDGPISSPFQKFGRWMLMTSDNGEMRILELVPTDDENPVRLFAADRFDSKGGEQAFLLTEGSNLWVGGQAIIRYRINRNQGQFSREVIVEPNDTFISPIHKLDDYLFHVRRRNGSGMISASLVDKTSLKPVWRTDFGGQPAGPPLLYEEKIVSVSNQGDLFSIDATAESNGYADQPVRASAVVETLKFENLITLPANSFACIGPADRQDLLFADGVSTKTKLMTLGPPADKPACRPIAIGEDLVIPSATGQVARIDPRTSRMVGTPFQPPVKPGSTTPWFEPTLLPNNVIAVATGLPEDGGSSMLYLLNGENKRSLTEIASLASEAPFKSRLVNDGTNIFGVAGNETGDRLVSLTSADPLAVQKETNLAGALVGGPWITAEGILVHLDNDRLHCFGNDLSEKWSIDIPNDAFACQPQIIGAQLMLAFRSGNVDMVDPTTGKSVNRFNVGQPIIHAPLRRGQKMYFNGMDGTIHVIDLSQLP